MSDKGGRLETGDLVGERWQISHRLGVGDLGEVYEAYDVVQSSAVAVKLLAPQVLANRSSYDDFVRAAKKGSELLGACSARIEAIDVDGASGSPFVVSEKLDAPSLEAHVKKGNIFTAERLLEMLSALAPSFDRTHREGLVHGDLKPTNVFLPQAGGVRLTDFGMSTLRDDPWAGPPGWCAPELFEAGAKATPQSDVYALALLAFFALTGKHAFAAADPLDRQRLPGTARAGLRSASARAAALGTKLDLRLDRWFFVALDAKRENRFKSVTELTLGLAKQLGVTVSLEEPPPVAVPAAKAEPAKGTTEPKTEVSARPMVVLDATPPPGAVGSGIAAVSVKPLIFASDLPAPPAAPEPEAPRPAAPAVEADAPEAPRTEALRPEAPRAEPLRIEPDIKTEKTPLGFPAPHPMRSAPVDALGKTVAFSEAHTAQAEPAHVSIPEEPAPSTQKPASGVTVPLSVVLAAAAAILGIGIAMLALVLWIMSDRHAPSEQRTQASAVEPPAQSAPPGHAPTTSKSAEPPAAAPSAVQPEEAAQEAPSPSESAKPEEPAAPADGPLPAGMASLTVECTPVACESAFCDAKRYDATKPILLHAGKHVCKGVASGYNMKGVELKLAAGDRVKQRFEMLPKKEEAAAAKPGKKKPCGTFINPCK